jgi:hypothetical protein
MVKRNITGPFRFVCLTDDPTGIVEGVECHPCPTVNFPEPYHNWGWRKLAVWDKTVAGLQPGDALFLDLDIVITGSIDIFFEIPGDFIVCPNWPRPGENHEIGNTSVFRFRVGAHPYLLESAEKDPEGVLASYDNEQIYVSLLINKGAKSFWKDPLCCSFKVHCVPKGVRRWFLEPTLPEGTRIVIFPGVPNPHEAVAGVWPAPWYKKLYKHIKPTKWVGEHWA